MTAGFQQSRCSQGIATMLKRLLLNPGIFALIVATIAGLDEIHVRIVA